MTTATSPGRRADDRLLDRLVDGELDAAARAGLLRCLDAEPDGWRRCAIAFLEAQAWQQAMRPPAQSAFSAPPAAVVHPPRRRQSWRGAAALAAAVVVAFATGFFARGSSDGQGAGVPYVMHRPAEGRQPEAAPERVQLPRPAQQLGLWTAATDSSGVSAERPVYASDGAAADGLLRRPPALPEYVRRQLEREGYEVSADRKLMSVALSDGRQVTVPVEAYKYRFVGHRLH